MARQIVAVSAGLGVPSSTRLLADQLGEATERAVAARGEEARVSHLELRPLAHALADHLLTGFPSPELRQALHQVAQADGLIVVTPVFSASYSGLFKTFFDVMEQGALDGTPVVIAATAGTARHSLILEHALRPLFAHLHAVVAPTGVFAASEDFGNTSDGSIDKRVERAAAELAALVGGPEGVRPVATRRPRVEDEFEHPTPFEDLLRRASEGPPEY